MRKILILAVTISLLLCSTARAYQGGGGESTKKGSSRKKEATKKKNSGAKSANNNGSSLPERATQEPIASNHAFFDDFETNNIQSHWRFHGNSVIQTNGVITVAATVADAGGSLESTPIEIANNLPLTIKRRVIFHFANNYFNGMFRISLASDPQQAFGINYTNYSYESENEVPKYGFYLFRKNAMSHHKREQGDISERIEPVWDKWVEEKIIYFPNTGVMEYFINEVKLKAFNVGVFPKQARYQITLFYDAWGWWTGHFQSFDDIEIAQ